SFIRDGDAGMSKEEMTNALATLGQPADKAIELTAMHMAQMKDIDPGNQEAFNKYLHDNCPFIEPGQVDAVRAQVQAFRAQQPAVEALKQALLEPGSGDPAKIQAAVAALNARGVVVDGKPVQLDAQSISGIQGTVRDVTEHNKA